MKPQLKKIRYKHKLVATLLQGKEKVLDIGYAKHPNPFLNNAHGIDIQDLGKPANFIETKIANLNTDKIPYPNKFFDGITACGLIEHLENPQDFLRECNRVLKIGGKLVLTTPNILGYMNVLGELLNRPDGDKGAHFQEYSQRVLKRILRRNGFSNVQVRGMFFRLNKRFWFKTKNCWLSPQLLAMGTKAKNPETKIMYGDGTIISD
ncbi:class I SAM-dependent methyltransferase [Candidatus Woesearchaeota archaeon]|nr:class I SAM-dependent methyltransferase [Candidatus Woesearchaeota archaeon]